MPRALVRLHRVLVLLALIVVMLVGALGLWLLRRVPEPAAAPPAGAAYTATAGDLRLTMELDQSGLAARAIDLTARDLADRPADLSGVRLRFAMAAMDMGSPDVDAQRVDAGHYRALGQFFSMAGQWVVTATVQRAGQAPLDLRFDLAIAAPGEAGGPLNPLAPSDDVRAAGRLLYQANCAACHGSAGRGDGPAGIGLSPRPGDFTQHMVIGKHTDGQVFLWIRDGFPGSAMPAWRQRFSDDQIWQLVTYLRSFGQLAAPAGATQEPTSAPTAQLAPATPAQALPPLVLARQGSLWRVEEGGAAPRQLTHLDAGSYAEYPAVSRDGRQIAFIATSQAPITDQTPLPLPLPTTALYHMNADGSGAQLLWKPERGVLGWPAWAPGDSAVYVGLYDLRSAPDAPVPDRLFQVLRVSLSGERKVVLTDARDPSFSSDGKLLAYIGWQNATSSFTLNVAAPDGSGQRQLIGAAGFSELSAPRFAPDGQQIIFVAIGGPPTDPQGYPIKLSQESPLDRLLGLFAPPTAEAHGAPADVWAIKLDGSGLHRITTLRADTPMAQFTPNGRQIVLMGAGGLYLVDPDDGSARQIDPLGDHGGLDWLRAAGG